MVPDLAVLPAVADLLVPVGAFIDPEATLAVAVSVFPEGEVLLFFMLLLSAVSEPVLLVEFWSPWEMPLLVEPSGVFWDAPVADRPALLPW